MVVEAVVVVEAAVAVEAVVEAAGTSAMLFALLGDLLFALLTHSSHTTLPLGGLGGDAALAALAALGGDPLLALLGSLVIIIQN